MTIWSIPVKTLCHPDDTASFGYGLDFGSPVLLCHMAEGMAVTVGQNVHREQMVDLVSVSARVVEVSDSMT